MITNGEVLKYLLYFPGNNIGKILEKAGIHPEGINCEEHTSRFGSNFFSCEKCWSDFLNQEFEMPGVADVQEPEEEIVEDPFYESDIDESVEDLSWND